MNDKLKRDFNYVLAIKNKVTKLKYNSDQPLGIRKAKFMCSALCLAKQLFYVVKQHPSLGVIFNSSNDSKASKAYFCCTET